MNKNIKRIIAMALAFGSISALAPAVNVNLFTTKAYAAENDETTLDSLKLETSDGSTIRLYGDSDYDSDSRLDSNDKPEEDIYYAKTSANSIRVRISGPSSKYVKVFKGTSDNTKGKSISSDISISSDTTLTIRVYDDLPGSDVEYDDDNDDASIESEYKIKIKYTGDDSNSDEESYDDIYLDRLSINGDSISLSDSKTKYSYTVTSNVDKVTIKAVPKDDNDTVTIDGYDVDEDNDKYKHAVSLDKGENEVKVEIEDSDSNHRVYTLNINRGGNASNTASTQPDTATNISTLKTSQWVQINGVWQYNDALGNPLKNMWFFDKNLGKNYYLQGDGSMAVGWLYNNGASYYLGADGAMRTGWQAIGGSWYYFNADGKMVTGWIKDTNGKYYFLNSNGTMASNTTISGYKLGADGAWIGR